MQAFSRLAARATFHLLKSIYYLLAPLVKRDRGWEGRGWGWGSKARGRKRESDGCIKQQPPAEQGMEKLLAPT